MKTPRKMISSSAPNRSFLYGNRESLKISDKLVYATLDCLALKGATLPLQLLPIDDNEIANANEPDKKERKIVRRKSSPRRPSFKVPPPGSTQYKKARPKINHTKAESFERRECAAVGNSGCARKVHRKTQRPSNSSEHSKRKQPNGKVESVPTAPALAFDSLSCPTDEKTDKTTDTGSQINNQRSQSLCQLDCVESVQTIHKVTSIDQFDSAEKKQKKKKEFGFAKNVLHYVPISSHVQRYRSLAKKSSEIFKSEHKLARTNQPGSRDDVRNLTISTPSNFVHVASATSPKLITVEARRDTNQVVIYHQQKFADLRSHENPEEKSDDESAKKNSSFLYGTRNLLGEIDNTGYVAIKTKPAKQPEKAAGTEKSEELKTSAIEVVEENGSAIKISSSVERPPNNSFLWSISQTKVPSQRVNDDALKEDDDIYDDVGGYDESIYDDVGPSVKLEQESNCLFDDEDYDEVMPAGYNPINEQPSAHAADRNDILEPSKSGIPSKEDDHCKNRNNESSVNDYYLPTTQGNVNVCIDSEEGKKDASEDSLYDDVDLQSQDRINSLYGGSIVIEETELANFKISLSSCNVNQVSSCDQSSVKQVSLQQKRQPSILSMKSFSSLSTVEDPENSDASSDENNYETLTSLPGELDSDSETETTGSYNVQQVSTLEAPTKPNPPPPREASMTHSLGKKIQRQLKRNWTITKGSLGRIRRKSNVDSDSTEENGLKITSPLEKIDAKKYFTFRKKNKKTRPTVSTFYIDSDQNELRSSQEQEDIYNKSIYYNGWKDSDSSQSDDFKEPLYQFYTAATARFASQSDSDGYEEVERIASLTESVDISKPLHLVLWCQTPQVINNGLLRKLTVEEKRLQEAKFEILTSEVRYLNSLRVLDSEFANDHELIHEVLTPGERERLFAGVQSVLTASENFLSDLESVWNDDPMMNRFPEVILKHTENFHDVYFTYCSNQVLIEGTLKELKTKKEQRFLDTVQKIERRPACQHLPLHSFLMLPMQRVTRLPLLADAVLSKLPVDHNQRSSWEEVFSNLNYVVAQCNEGARRAGQRAELKALERKLIYPINVAPIALEGRELVRSGPVIHLTLKSDADYKLTFGKKFQKNPLYLFLLTDYLLVTKPKTSSNSEESTYTVIDTCKRNLITLAPVEKDSPFSGHHAMVLDLLENCAGRPIEFVLACGSDTEIKRWLNTITPFEETLGGETLYESWDCPQVTALYSYTPTQPDELALQVGDVINVSKKLSDGWYYGKKLLDEKQGWFPANHTQEIASEHVRARNLRQRHRFLALSAKHIMNLKTKN